MRKFIIIVLLAGVAVTFFWTRYLTKIDLPNIPDPIVVVTAADYPPLCFKQEGKIVGFDIDVVNEVARRLEKNIKIEDTMFEALMPSVQVGRAQVIAAGIAATDERKKTLDFTTPYLVNDPLIILSRADAPQPVASLNDLQGKRVVVNTGHNADAFMTKMDKIIVTRVAAMEDAIALLRAGTVDAYVVAQHTAGALLNTYGAENFRVTPLKDTSENVALGISRRYPQLKAKMIEAVDQMLKDGTIEQLKQKWHIQ